MEYTFRPLSVWPHASTWDRRSRWTFKANWSDTIRKLASEIEKLNGHNVVIATLHSAADIRQDGLPRSNAREPTHPGVEISFDVPAGADPKAVRGRALIRQHGSYNQAIKATHPDTSGYDSAYDFVCVQATREKGRMVMATDVCERWEHNIRSIALTLEALRAVDRYGATQGRQYAGFRGTIDGNELLEATEASTRRLVAA